MVTIFIIGFIILAIIAIAHAISNGATLFQGPKNTQDDNRFFKQMQEDSRKAGETALKDARERNKRFNEDVKRSNETFKRSQQNRFGKNKF